MTTDHSLLDKHATARGFYPYTCLQGLVKAFICPNILWGSYIYDTNYNKTFIKKAFYQTANFLNGYTFHCV